MASSSNKADDFDFVPLVEAGLMELVFVNDVKVQLDGNALSSKIKAGEQLGDAHTF